MDRESADAMRVLDLAVAPSFYGKKSIDYFGRLRRADTSASCSAVDNFGVAVDYSNSTTCSNNAELHVNVCRSFMPCFGSNHRD